MVRLCSYFSSPKEPTLATTGVIAFSKAGEKQTAEPRPGTRVGGRDEATPGNRRGIE
jgi:hypothetical protein